VFASQTHFAQIDVNLMQLGTLQSHHCTTDNSLIGNDVYDVTDNLPAAAAAALYKALAHESHVSEQFPQCFFGTSNNGVIVNAFLQLLDRSDRKPQKAYDSRKRCEQKIE